MLSRKKIILSILIILVLCTLLVWKFVINKKIDDYKNQKPHYNLTSYELFKAIENYDSTNVKKYIDALIEVTGNIKNINMENENVTVEMGSDTSMNTISFQMDTRHLKELNNIKPYEEISIKGICAGYEIDDELGLGSTIYFKYSSITKLKNK